MEGKGQLLSSENSGKLIVVKMCIYECIQGPKLVYRGLVLISKDQMGLLKRTIFWSALFFFVPQINAAPCFSGTLPIKKNVRTVTLYFLTPGVFNLSCQNNET